MKKVAVVLFNLGGPSDLKSVRPFLFNLFNDPAITQIPQPFRWAFAFMMSRLRNEKAQAIYAKIGSKSPILEQTLAQAASLEASLKEKSSDANTTYKVFVCMRYWHPMSDEVAAKVSEFNPDEVILLPLYPQYSISTTRSSLENWHAATQKYPELRSKQSIELCCYPNLEGLIAYYAKEIRKALSEQPDATVLFSAHGLPVRFIKQGDPYEEHVQTLSKLVIKRVREELEQRTEYIICYQSKVGPLKWLRPPIDEVIKWCPTAGKISLIIVPISFVSEHSETLVELDIEYAELAHSVGIKHYKRIQTPQVSDDFIGGLAELCIKKHKPYKCSANFRMCHCFVDKDS